MDVMINDNKNPTQITMLRDNMIIYLQHNNQNADDHNGTQNGKHHDGTDGAEMAEAITPLKAVLIPKFTMEITDPTIS